MENPTSELTDVSINIIEACGEVRGQFGWVIEKFRRKFLRRYVLLFALES